MRRIAIHAAMVAALAASVSSVWAEGWRIGVAGPWATGEVGFLGRNGMPRERLLDNQLADPAVLRQYRIIIVSGPVARWAEIAPLVEAYVREGGCAILEYTAFPTTGVLPGERIDGQAGPNVVIEPGHPSVQGIPAGRTYARMGEPSAAIVPPAGSGVTVLARYTEVGVGDKIAGRFVRDGQSVPAIIHAPLGRGHLVYSGPWLGDGLAYGLDYRDLMLGLLGFLTQGNVVPRLALAGTGNVLIGRSLSPANTTPAQVPSPPSVPEGFALVENLGATFSEYDVAARTDGDADLLLDYLSPTQYHAVHLRKDSVRVGAATGAAEVELTAATRGSRPTGAAVVVARRNGLVRVLVDGKLVVEAADRGQWGGLVAAKGLADPAFQPIAPVEFTDDFMREQGDQGDWQAVSGSWQIASSEGSPAQGANPFSYGAETTATALATTGDWFWDDYRVEASARWTQNATGLAFHYRDTANYDLLEADQAAQTLRLVRLRGGQAQVLKEVPAALRPWQWYRLGVEASGGLTVCSLDGNPRLEARDREAGSGAIGLCIRNARAAFDDVTVSDWNAFTGQSGASPATWRSLGGKWEWPGDGRIAARGGDHPDALLAPGLWGDGEASVDLRLGKAQQAGLRLRGSGGKACDVVLQRTGSGAQVQLSLPQRQGSPITRDVPVKGLKPDAWHTLSVAAIRDHVSCTLDGAVVADAASIDLPRGGAISLVSEGLPGAEFRSVDIRTASGDLRAVDPATPAYAGVVDVATWATPAGGWLPDPTDLPLFWHEGALSGDLRLWVGVHKTAGDKVAAKMVLAPLDGAATGRYAARFEHQWGTPETTLVLERAGKEVARGTRSGHIPADGFVAELERSGQALVLRVDGEAGLAFNDPAPLACPRVGVRVDGATLCYDDILLQSANVRTDTFTQAPSDWLAQAGTWEVTSRWTCSPGPTWLSGLAPQYAIAQSKWEVEGDTYLDTYLGAKMMDTPSGRKEILQDIRLGICGRPGFLNSGYFFLIGAKGGAWTALQRNGLVVAETTNFAIPQSSLHNDWFRFGVRKQGAKVTLLFEGQPVLSYTDPEPLPGGRVSMGTYDNGIMVPRVTVYGEGIRG